MEGVAAALDACTNLSSTPLNGGKVQIVGILRETETPVGLLPSILNPRHPTHPSDLSLAAGGFHGNRHPKMGGGFAFW
jgi:hypothetical protein